MKRASVFRVSESGLSARAKNVLRAMAHVVYDRNDWITWSSITKQRLLREKNCGRTTANEILRYGVVHASPKQAERLKCMLMNQPCPTCGRLWSGSKEETP